MTLNLKNPNNNISTYLVIIILALMIFIMSSCTRGNEEITNNLSYFKDYRTDLCFAQVQNGVTASNNYSLSITCVPCENVKHLIK